MPELEQLRGLRVVCSPDALEAASWTGQSAVLRLAPDDALAIDATDVDGARADEHALIVEERGFVGAWLTPAQLVEWVGPHIEWRLSDARPALAQGLIAGVPAKLWLSEERVLLLCATAYAHELAERLE